MNKYGRSVQVQRNRIARRQYDEPPPFAIKVRSGSDRTSMAWVEVPEVQGAI